MSERSAAHPRSTPLAGCFFSRGCTALPQPRAIKRASLAQAGPNHSSLTVASRSTIAPPRMYFTLPLYSEQNRGGEAGRIGLRGRAKGTSDQVICILRPELCFCLTCRMSKCLFFKKKKKRNSMDSLYRIFFALVTVQHFQHTLTIHACMA